MSPNDRTTLVTLERLGADPRIAETGNIIILITENIGELHPTLTRAATKFEQIEIPLPTHDDRKAYIEAQVKARELQLENGLSTAEFAASTAMLGYVHIEDICLRAVNAGGTVTRSLIRERKSDIIKAEFRDVIQIMDPATGFDGIGGLEEIKSYLTRSVIDPIRKGNLDRVPVGIMFMGPPGTGKTLVAKALAKESGFNCLVYDPSKLYGGIVGATERNQAKAHRAIEAMAPTIVFIDEVDQLGGRSTGSGDSGVSSRFFKRILEFTSDPAHRGKIVFIYATNRPDLLDEAFRRDGRVDVKLVFPPPDENQRTGIVRVAVRERGLQVFDPTPEMIKATEGWTGAEISNAARIAAELVEDEGLDSATAFLQATQDLIPSTKNIEYMMMLALREVNSKRLLPERYRKQADNRAAIDEKIEEMQPRGRVARQA